MDEIFIFSEISIRKIFLILKCLKGLKIKTNVLQTNCSLPTQHCTYALIMASPLAYATLSITLCNCLLPRRFQTFTTTFISDEIEINYNWWLILDHRTSPLHANLPSSSIFLTSNSISFNLDMRNLLGASVNDTTSITLEACCDREHLLDIKLWPLLKSDKGVKTGEHLAFFFLFFSSEAKYIYLETTCTYLPASKLKCDEKHTLQTQIVDNYN